MAVGGVLALRRPAVGAEGTGHDVLVPQRYRLWQRPGAVEGGLHIGAGHQNGRLFSTPTAATSSLTTVVQPQPSVLI